MPCWCGYPDSKIEIEFGRIVLTHTRTPEQWHNTKLIVNISTCLYLRRKITKEFLPNDSKLVKDQFRFTVAIYISRHTIWFNYTVLCSDFAGLRTVEHRTRISLNRACWILVNRTSFVHNSKWSPKSQCQQQCHRHSTQPSPLLHHNNSDNFVVCVACRYNCIVIWIDVSVDQYSSCCEAFVFGIQNSWCALAACVVTSENVLHGIDDKQQ